MMTILIVSSWTTFLDRAPLGEDLMIAPPYATMGETLLSTSSLGLFLKMGGKLQAYDLIEILVLNLHYHHDDDHHLTSSSMDYLDLPFDASSWNINLTPHRYTTYAYMG